MLFAGSGVYTRTLAPQQHSFPAQNEVATTTSSTPVSRIDLLGRRRCDRPRSSRSALQCGYSEGPALVAAEHTRRAPLPPTWRRRRGPRGSPAVVGGRCKAGDFSRRGLGRIGRPGRDGGTACCAGVPRVDSIVPAGCPRFPPLAAGRIAQRSHATGAASTKCGGVTASNPVRDLVCLQRRRQLRGAVQVQRAHLPERRGPVGAARHLPGTSPGSPRRSRGSARTWYTRVYV